MPPLSDIKRGHFCPNTEKIIIILANAEKIWYHKDNENYLENIMKEISMIASENKWPR